MNPDEWEERAIIRRYFDRSDRSTSNASNAPHLIFMDNVQFISLNYNWLMNKLPVVRDVCDRADDFFLQETWCITDDLDVFIT